jgi:hypothetical protein
MYAFVQKYSEFVEKVDSTAMENGRYHYNLSTFINLEITDLSNIAWDVSKSTGIFNEFGYDCLYDLQALYNTQDLVKSQMKTATEALRNKSIEELASTLGFMKQLEDQLAEQYQDMLESIDECK